MPNPKLRISSNPPYMLVYMGLRPKTWTAAIGVILMLLSSVRCGKPVVDTTPEILLQVISRAPQYDPEDNPEDYLKNPIFIEIVRDTLLVTDAGREGILRYGLDGHFIDVIGRRGSGPGEFIEPHETRMDPLGRGFWVKSLGKCSLLDFSGRYILGFPDPVSAEYMAILPDSSLVLTTLPLADRGGLICVNEQGEILWDASPRIIIDGAEQYVYSYNRALVTVIDRRIWWVNEKINQIRVFNLEGQLIKEFALQDEYVEMTDIASHQGLQELVAEGRGGPDNIFLRARGAFGYIWIMIRSRFTPEVSRNRRYIYQIDPDGSVYARYYFELDSTAVFDFVPIEISPQPEFVLLAPVTPSRLPQMIWCSVTPRIR